MLRHNYLKLDEQSGYKESPIFKKELAISMLRKKHAK